VEEERQGYSFNTEDASTIISTNSGEDCVEIEGDPGIRMHWDSPDKAIVPTEYHDRAGYTRNDEDKLAKLITEGLTGVIPKVVERNRSSYPP
jgi:hypothetical protein